MPRITVPLPNNYSSISRPVCMSIARDVMKICGIPDDTAVYMAGEFEVSNQATGLMGSNPTPKLSGERRVRVIAEDKTRDSSILNQIVMSNEMPPIFNDPALGVSVRPIYVESDVTLSFVYVCKSRQEAIKWADNFAVAQAQHRSSIHHQVKYNIPLQDGIVALLAHVHELRENIAGYGEDFTQYFDRISCREIITEGARDGDPDKLSFAIPELQTQITGWFEFSDIPTPRKVSNDVTWEIEFTYRMCYHRCVNFYVVYPLMVHQQFIDSKYYDTTPRFSVEELPKRGALVVRAFDQMDGHVDSLPPPSDGLRVPYWDEWIPGRGGVINRSVPAITWMIQLHPEDPQDILNLTQLPDMRFTLEMVRYMQDAHRGLTRMGHAGVFFTLYMDNVAMDEDTLVIDEQLNVRTKRPLDLRHQYHLRLNIPTWYPSMRREALLLMSKHAHATIQILDSVKVGISFNVGCGDLLEGQLPFTPMIDFYKELQDKEAGYLNGGGVGYPTNRGEASSTKYLGQMKVVQYLAIMTSNRQEELDNGSSNT